MSDHGHVTPNADGSKARCGGPALCGGCAKEAAARWKPDQKRGLKVTVEDLETGDIETAEVPMGEYLLLCTEPCHVSHTQMFGGGKTVQLTIKGRVLR